MMGRSSNGKVPHHLFNLVSGAILLVICRLYRSALKLSLHYYYKSCTHIVSVLGREEGYTVKYNPLPEGDLMGESQGNS